MRAFLICLIVGVTAASWLVGPADPSPGVEAAIAYFRKEAGEFAQSCTELRTAAEDAVAADSTGSVRTGSAGSASATSATSAGSATSATSAGSATSATSAGSATSGLAGTEQLRRRLADARLRYKRIESFLEYFFRSSATIYNRPPKFEAEDGSMEYQQAVGMQLMETLLYAQRFDRVALLAQAKAVESSALDLRALLYGLKADDRQLLESLRIELVRIITLDITGYEAPYLKSGIEESRVAMEAMGVQLAPYLGIGGRGDSVRRYLGLSVGMLQGKFDEFDRLRFLRAAALPLQRQLGLLIREKGLEANTTKTLNYGAEDIFSPDAFFVGGFSGGGGSTRGLGAREPEAPESVARGRRLFFDSSLSGNGRKSCASCHQPAKAFTDGLRVSVGLDGHRLLDRNAPTLLYCGYQFAQFWDGRVKTLEEQIRTVLRDKREMGADTAREEDVASIAAYVRSLRPMNSVFDRYMRSRKAAIGGGFPGDSDTLSEGARRGANLFMGKAQCATCHFIPLFNGLIPPDYAVTEFEVLGTTEGDGYLETGGGRGGETGARTGGEMGARSDGGMGARSDGDNGMRLSRDSGRYGPYPLPFFRGAFKTPTVRNAALTAPYMHNGGFKSLESVLQFYNAGGGAGLGLSVPEQTLSSDSLRLSASEMNDIILFIHTLTDSLSTAP